MIHRRDASGILSGAGQFVRGERPRRPRRQSHALAYEIDDPAPLLAPLPEHTASYFDARSIGKRENGVGDGNRISRFPGEAFGRCRDRLIVSGGAGYYVHPKYGANVHIYGRLLVKNCQFWKKGENNVFIMVPPQGSGGNKLLAAQTDYYESPSGLIVEIIDGRVCVSRRGGSPVLRSRSRVTFEWDGGWAEEVEPFLIRLHTGAEGTWSLYLNGALEDRAKAGVFTPGAEDVWSAGAASTKSQHEFDIPFVQAFLNVAGPVSSQELATVRRYAVERAGVQMRLPENLLPEARGALASCIEGGTVDMRCAEAMLSECVTDAGEIADACLRDGRPGENPSGEPGGRTPALMSRASLGYWPILVAAAGGLLAFMDQ